MIALQKIKITMLIPLMVLLYACADTTDQAQLDGDPSQTSLSMKISTTNLSSNGLFQALITSERLHLTKAVACIEEIELKLPDGITCEEAGFTAQPNLVCEEELEEEDGQTYTESKIKAYGPFRFDLLTGTSTPSLSNITIPSGIYREIEFEFNGGCSLGDEISIVLEGTAKDSMDTMHPFLMELDYDDELEIESETKVEVLENQSNEVLTTLVVEDWFVEADWIECIENENLTPIGEGVYVLNENTEGLGVCSDIYDDILDGIEDALEFEDDDSGNDDDYDD